MTPTPDARLGAKDLRARARYAREHGGTVRVSPQLLALVRTAGALEPPVSSTLGELSIGQAERYADALDRSVQGAA